MRRLSTHTPARSRKIGCIQAGATPSTQPRQIRLPPFIATTIQAAGDAVNNAAPGLRNTAFNSASGLRGHTAGDNACPGVRTDTGLGDGRTSFIRSTGERDLIVRGRTRNAREVARECPMMFAETIVKMENGKEKALPIEYGFRAVQLPGHSQPLFLVVIRGFGSDPLMLLTNVALTQSRKSLWFIVKGYLARWRVEETIRFIKQSYHLEDVRVLDYERLRNLVALVSTKASRCPAAY